MPFAQAVERFTLPVVSSLARSPQMLSNWENREGYVPWKYLAHVAPEGPALVPNGAPVLPGIWHPDPSEVPPSMVAEWNDAARDLYKVLSGLDQSDTLRTMVLANLRDAALAADRAKSSRRGRGRVTRPTTRVSQGA